MGNLNICSKKKDIDLLKGQIKLTVELSSVMLLNILYLILRPELITDCKPTINVKLSISQYFFLPPS